MNITADQIRKVAPRAGANAKIIAASLNPAMERFDITDRLRAVNFIGQLVVESGQFTRTRENFNYTPEAILRTFNTVKVTRFTVQQARELGRLGERHAKQEAIANIAYANRMGNGDAKSGDGWKNRGAGWLQLTGDTNLTACAKAFGIEREKVADWLCTPIGAAMGAAWFWSINNINRHADRDDVDACSDLVNIGRLTERLGDANGYNERVLAVQECKRVWA